MKRKYTKEEVRSRVENGHWSWGSTRHCRLIVYLEPSHYERKLFNNFNIGEGREKKT